MMKWAYWLKRAYWLLLGLILLVCTVIASQVYAGYVFLSGHDTRAAVTLVRCGVGAILACTVLMVVTALAAQQTMPSLRRLVFLGALVLLALAAALWQFVDAYFIYTEMRTKLLGHH